MKFYLGCKKKYVSGTWKIFGLETNTTFIGMIKAKDSKESIIRREDLKIQKDIDSLYDLLKSCILSNTMTPNTRDLYCKDAITNEIKKYL